MFFKGLCVNHTQKSLLPMELDKAEKVVYYFQTLTMSKKNILGKLGANILILNRWHKYLVCIFQHPIAGQMQNIWIVTDGSSRQRLCSCKHCIFHVS